MKKLIELSYDLTEVNFEELRELFHKFNISTGAEISMLKSFISKKDMGKIITREDMRPNQNVTPYELGLSAYGWTFSSYRTEGVYKIWMGANPFANGLLGDTTQGTRGEGYCSYIKISTTDRDFATEFNKLVTSGNCKEVFDNSDIV